MLKFGSQPGWDEEQHLKVARLPVALALSVTIGVPDGIPYEPRERIAVAIVHVDEPNAPMATRAGKANESKDVVSNLGGEFKQATLAIRAPPRLHQFCE